MVVIAVMLIACLLSVRPLYQSLVSLTRTAICGCELDTITPFVAFACINNPDSGVRRLLFVCLSASLLEGSYAGVGVAFNVNPDTDVDPFSLTQPDPTQYLMDPT